MHFQYGLLTEDQLAPGAHGVEHYMYASCREDLGTLDVLFCFPRIWYTFFFLVDHTFAIPLQGYHLSLPVGGTPCTCPKHNLIPFSSVTHFTIDPGGLTE